MDADLLKPGSNVYYQRGPPPPPPCESNTLVRATVGVVSATFGTVEFGGPFFWWSMKITFFW